MSFDATEISRKTALLKIFIFRIKKNRQGNSDKILRRNRTVRIDIGSSYYIEDGRGKQFRDSVYADEIELKPSPNKTPKRIILPECSNIHILAIKHCKGASNE